RRPLRGGGQRPVGPVERTGLAGRGRLGGHRVRQPARRVPVELRPGRGGGGHRHRRARRVDGVLGAAARVARTGRGAHSGGDRGYGLASYVDGLQSAGRIEEALALTEESVAAARRVGNPYWVAYALWIAGMAFSRTNARRALAAWEEGIAYVREHRIHFFEGFLARDAARLNTSDGEPDVALGLFAEAIQAFHRAGNVPQLIITLASVPALFERLDRLEPAAMLLGAMPRESASFH